MFKIQVKDFGPIAEGSVDLKPLTIFIGQNNSGKSYLAMLIYSLLQSYMPRHIPRMYRTSLRQRDRFYTRSYHPSLIDRFVEQNSDTAKIASALRKWLEDLEEPASDSKTVPFGELPEEIRALLDESVDESVRFFVLSLNQELQRCYGSELADLTRRTAGSESLQILIEQDIPPWRVSLSSTNNDFQEIESAFDLSDESLTFRPHAAGPFPRRVRRRNKSTRVPDEELLFLLAPIYDQILGQILSKFYQYFPTSTYYLPAARSGILQSHKALASFVVSRSPLVGIEPIDIPRLTGVVADFIGNLLPLEEGDEKTSLYKVADFLEGEVIRGSISLEAGKLEYPEIYYETRSGKFPLHRTSSMVSELAPVILFLKHLITSHDMLILEEPESHLHPPSQFRLARGIAKLIRAGTRVLITTHSENFLAQLSNLIRLSQLSAEERIKRGYSEEDYLQPEEVGAYLFRFENEWEGSFVEELSVTLEDGIPEEEFSKVIEELYDETVYLARRIQS